MRHKDVDNYWTVHYDSIEDLTAHVTSSGGNERLYRFYDRADQYQWLGVGTRKEVVQLTEKGWPDGLERMRRCLEHVQMPVLPSLRRRKAQGAFGDAVDMQRVYAGSLDRAWSTFRREEQAVRTWRTATVLINVGGMVNITPEQLFWNGATALRIAEALVRSGRGTKIVLYSHALNTYDGRQAGVSNYLGTVTLKTAGQPLCVERVATATALAGFFRHWIFLSRASAPHRCNGNMGLSVPEVPEAVEAQVEGHRFVVARCWTEQEAKDALARFAAEGIPHPETLAL